MKAHYDETLHQCHSFILHQRQTDSSFQKPSQWLGYVCVCVILCINLQFLMSQRVKMIIAVCIASPVPLSLDTDRGVFFFQTGSLDEHQIRVKIVLSKYIQYLHNIYI